MTANDKLDAVLSIIVKNVPKYISDRDLVRKLKEQKVYNYLLLDYGLVIDKLVDDGFITIIKLNHVNINSGEVEKDVTNYKPTFNAVFFFQNGGYNGQYQQKIAESVQVGELRTRQMRLQTKLNRLTCWIAVGTCLAAVYYLIEILKYLKWIPTK